MMSKHWLVLWQDEEDQDEDDSSDTDDDDDDDDIDTDPLIDELADNDNQENGDRANTPTDAEVAGDASSTFLCGSGAISLMSLLHRSQSCLAATAMTTITTTMKMTMMTQRSQTILSEVTTDPI